MSLEIHTLEAPDGMFPGLIDRAVVGLKLAVANVVGGSAGASVTTVISGLLNLPASYTVLVQPNQDATAYVTAKTSTGFSVVLTPRLAANTLAAGTFDCVLLG